MTGRRFEKVTTKDHEGRKRTVLLEIAGESDAWLIGEEVEKEGSRLGHYDKDGALVTRTHMIDKGTILCRKSMVMNNHYGELEEA